MSLLKKLGSGLKKMGKVGAGIGLALADPIMGTLALLGSKKGMSAEQRAAAERQQKIAGYNKDIAGLEKQNLSLQGSSDRFSQVSPAYNAALARYGAAPAVNTYEQRRLSNLSNIDEYRKKIKALG